MSKIMEKLVCKLVMEDLKPNIHPGQFAGMKGLATDHYLVKMVDRILRALDCPTSQESTAVIASFIDWADAFPRVQHTLGMKSFIQNGLRPSLLPLVCNYFEDRKMVVRWKNVTSQEYDLPSSTPQGSSFGIAEFISISNDNARSVPDEDRFSYMDDLSILEIINLLNIGIASHNSRMQVSSNIPSHNQIIPPEHLQTQNYLNDITRWTEEKQMKLNESKTKVMIINNSRMYQFSTTLHLNEKPLQIVDQMKTLGVILSNDMKWDKNTQHIVRQANISMRLLHKACQFTRNISVLKKIYFSRIRSKLEYGCKVWHSSLTTKNRNDLERCQKSSLKLILGPKYENYSQALEYLKIQTLDQRRDKLCLRFAKKCLKLANMQQLFPYRSKQHNMDTRNIMKFDVNKSRSEKYKRSAIPQMQKALNIEYAKNIKRKQECMKSRE